MENYKKDFDKWNIEKKKINQRGIDKNNFHFYEREIWWTSIGVNVGVEMDGKNNNFERPVLIIYRINSNQFFGIPLTSKNKEGYLYHKVDYSDGENSGTANMVQFRVFSTKRLLRKIGMVKVDDFGSLKREFVKKFLN